VSFGPDGAYVPFEGIDERRGVLSDGSVASPILYSETVRAREVLGGYYRTHGQKYILATELLSQETPTPEVRSRGSPLGHVSGCSRQHS
jgi:hypothetical protein